MMEAKAILLKDQQITKNFNRREFEKSATAARKGWDNSVPEVYHINLIKLAQMLQVIRDAYGKPIIIGSGYRCPKVNRAVGGVTNSDHKYAAAADIKTVSDTFKENKELWDVIMRLKKEGKIQARQIIWEYGKKDVGMDWIHISVNNKYNGKKDNQVVYIGV